MRSALFDMDRTLVRKNTGNLYVRWRMKRREAGLRDVAQMTAWMLRYTLGFIDAPAVSARALATLAGVEEARFREDCAQWYAEDVRRYVTDAARREVDRRRREGAVCAILSAATPYSIDPLARDLGIEHVICTRLQVKDGRFTGAWEPPLCYGHGKLEAAETWAREHGIDLAQSSFYTDSMSDLPVLEQVAEPVVVNPDPRLRWHARRRRWRVESWT